MENKPDQHALGDKISDLIRYGITISNDVMHYIDSTFSNPSIEEFARILSDPSNCETDTVFELIFYPDRQIQEQLESSLKTKYYDADDVNSAISYLLQKEMTVPVTFPDQRGTLSVLLPDSTIRQFMVRLNITRQINARLVETLSRFVTDESENLRIRVLWRNCRAEFSDSVCAFLCTCIEKMYTASPYFWNAVKFLLNFFDYADPEADIYLGLMQEKKTILHSIGQAEKSEKALESNNVEVLMLKGVNILAINIADARKKIVLIDHICISIFGKTELYG